MDTLLDTATQADKVVWAEKTLETADGPKDVFFCCVGKFEVQVDKDTSAASAIYAQQTIAEADPNTRLLASIADAMARKAEAEKKELSAAFQKLLEDLTSKEEADAGRVEA